MTRLSQLVLGANSLVQGVLPKLLAIEDEYHINTIRMLEENAQFTVDRISAIPGLQIIVPHGAMYAMVRIIVEEFRDIADDTDFCNKMIEEQSVVFLPGQVRSLVGGDCRG